MTLYEKYRPTEFEDVIGQDEIVSSITANLKTEDAAKSFLFLGPAGVGKTTLARIISKHLGCNELSISEVDSATSGDIESIRNLIEMMTYAPMFGERKAAILDEVHALSQTAFNALLKSIEEPPPHALWILCTTEEGKIPKTIKSRCATYYLSPINQELLSIYVKVIANKEEINLSDDIADLIAESAQGSVRQALMYLDQARNISNLQEAEKLFLRVSQKKDSSVKEIGQLIANGEKNWSLYKKVINALKPEEYSGLRPILQSYITKVIGGTNSHDKFAWLANALDAAEQLPFQASEKDLYLFIGRVILN